MIDWTTVEDAIHAWVVDGSGLDANRVIWARQGGPRPEGEFIALSLSSVRRIGQDWLDVLDNPSSTGDDGFEILHRSRGVREAILEMQAFDGDAVGASSPAGLLHSVLSAMNLPTRRVALQDAGIGVAGFGPVQFLGGLLGSTVFESRAILEVRFFLAEEVEEISTYISQVEIESAPYPFDGFMARGLRPLAVLATGTVT